MRRYNNDPYILQSKWSTKCKLCGAHIDKGNSAFYWPATKTIKCLACGETDYQNFLSAAADEEVYAGTGNPY